MVEPCFWGYTFNHGIFGRDVQDIKFKKQDNIAELILTRLISDIRQRRLEHYIGHKYCFKSFLVLYILHLLTSFYECK